MSEPTQPAGYVPEHAFQVLSKTFATSEHSSWSQAGSGDLTAAEAHAWIDAQAAAVAEVGVREILPADAQLAADLASGDRQPGEVSTASGQADPAALGQLPAQLQPGV